MTKTRAGAFAGLGAMMAKGFDGSVTSDTSYQLVDLDQIEIRDQVREEFEDAENTLADLGRDLRKRQIQPILLRPNLKGAEKPFLLVSGERRVKAARLEGLTALAATVAIMTDEEAYDAQLSENIHRKNLTQVEEARRVQRDLEQLGSVEAVLAKYNKSRAWLSQITSLLTLPEHTKRLVSEDISADLALINAVKVVEKHAPERAAELVDQLKQTRGKADARKIVEEARAQVKPKPSKNADGAAKKAVGVLLDELADAVRRGGNPADIWGAVGLADQHEIEGYLKLFHAMISTSDLPLAVLVMRGLAEGKLGHAGAKGLALSAVLSGGLGGEFDPVQILSGMAA
jgi:ParB family chromosome partitioning protein